MAKNKLLEKPDAPKARELSRAVDPEKLLTSEEKQAIREKAAAKIAARDKLDAEEIFLKQEMAKIDKELHPEALPEMREIRLDLALYADRVVLDGHAYFADELYTVPKPVYDVLKECAQNSKRHEDEIRSGNTADHFYRQSRQMSVNMRTGVATAGGAPVRF